MSSKEKARRDKTKNKNNRKNMIKEKFYEEEQEDILSNGDYENAFHKKNEVTPKVTPEVTPEVIQEITPEVTDKPTENEDISDEEEFNDDYFKQEIVK
jgi:hypothetical protein